MKNLLCLSLLLLCCVLCASNVSAQCDGYAYIYSETTPAASSVYGYTTTYLDYCAGIYYDPEVLGTFTEALPGGPAIIGEGYSQGYADQRPAEVQFDYRAPLHSAPYTVTGSHFLIAYYQVWVEVWTPGYYWYDPFQFGFGEIGGGNEIYSAPDYFGYFNYVSYWISAREYIGVTADTKTYSGPTYCLPGQQFTSTGQPCSSIPDCQSGQQFTSTGELCPNYVPPPEPPVQPVVSVALKDDILYPAGLPAKLSLTQKSRNTPAAACITGVPDPAGRSVNLQIINDTVNSGFDGGHKDSLHKGPRPLGNLGRSAGVTGADGCFKTTYMPPHIAGKLKLKATISGISAETDIWVYVPGLVRLLPGENYRLNGGIVDCNVADDSCTPTISRQAHPSNHWMVPDARTGLVKIADAYKTRFYGNGPIPPADMITYNDASLEWGGKFDINRNWSSENSNHGEHREGLSIDTRSTNLHGRDDEFIRIFFDNNFGFNDERKNPTGPHLHLRWADKRFTGIPGLLQNGIDQNAFAYDSGSETPATLAENLSWAIFERQATQQEFEFWYPRLTNAKSQGQNIFLQEVKTLEKQLFASQEYIARQRTDEQFVQDVFASHLFRQPTEPELSYWLSILADIDGTQQTDSTNSETSERTRTTIPINQSQKRQIFLNEFQSLPAFANRVAGIVDDEYQEPLN